MAKTLSTTHSNISQGPYKLRPVCDLVRGKRVSDALIILKFTPRTAAATIYKKLQSSASAAIDHSMDPERLVVKAIYCDQQMELKRQRIRSRGRSSIMRKRSSTVTIELVEADRPRPVRAATSAPSASANEKTE